MKKNSIFGAASLALAGLLALAFFSCADVSGGAAASGADLGGQASGSVSFSFSQDFLQKARDASREIVKNRGGLVSKNDGALGGDVVPEQEQQLQASKMRLDVYLDGDCEEKKSIDIALEGSAAPEEGKERTIPAQTVKFDNIAVGKKIYARIYVYTIYPYMDSKTEKEGEAEELTIFGKSSEITVAEGDNDLPVPAYYLYKNISFKATITFDSVPDLSGNSNSLLVIDPSSELAARLKAAKDNFEIYNILKTMDKEKGVMAETDLYDTENPETHERVKNYTLDGTTLVVENEFYLPVSEEDPAEKGRDILLALMLGKSSTDPQSYKMTYDAKFYGIMDASMTPKKKQTNEVSLNAAWLGIIDTKYSLYIKDGESSFQYKVSKSLSDMSAASTLSSDGISGKQSFCFDANGNFYALSISASGEAYIRSDNVRLENYECKFPSGDWSAFNSIACDIKRNELYALKDMGDDIYVLFGTGSLIETGNNAQYAYKLNLASAGASGVGDISPLNCEFFAVYDGTAYFVGSSLEGKCYVLKADLSKKSAAAYDYGRDNFNVDTEVVAEIPLPEGAGDRAEFSDMLYQDGAIYLLFNEKENGIDGRSYMASDGLYYKSRGALIKCDIATGETKTKGWTNEAQDISSAGFYAYYKDAGVEYNVFKESDAPDWNDTSKWLKLPGNSEFDVSRSGSDQYTLKNTLPKIYSPSKSAASNAFYGPQKFIAIKPKKLVIADNGAAFYTDNGGYYCKTARRVVTVDLESFAFSVVDNNSLFDKAVSGSIYASSFGNINTFNSLVSDNLYINNGSNFGKYSDEYTYLGIPLKEEE